jgi:predicted S18 family serine protease
MKKIAIILTMLMMIATTAFAASDLTTKLDASTPTVLTTGSDTEIFRFSITPANGGGDIDRLDLSRNSKKI